MTGKVIDVGDSCVTLELEARIDPVINTTCLLIAGQLKKSHRFDIRDIVTTYHTVAVHFDPLTTSRDAIVEELERLAMGPLAIESAPGPLREIPVCYGDELGPDLEDVARFANCSTEEVIKIHSQPTYRVYMIGFLPGFAYLGAVDGRIAMARHETPRMRVAAGSVAIAGYQTGIYPIESPGGWRIIGRTWVEPFDLRRADPSLFHAGDAVRFVPVSHASFVEVVERRDAAR